MNNSVTLKKNIRKSLGKDKDKYHIIVKDTTVSTNDDVKNAVKNSKAESIENFVEISLSQTEGRGRLGRKFYSPKNGGIYMSCFLKPKLCERDTVTLTSAAAVSVCRAIENRVGLSPKIKWVNDLYIDNKKICGILTEAVREPSGRLIGIVIGIGVNCIRCELPNELKNIVGFLSDWTDDVSMSKLASEIIKEIYRCENLVTSGSFRDEYIKRSMVLGKNIIVSDDLQKSAKVVDIDDKGGLVIQKNDGSRETLFTGEISIKIC